MSAPVLRYTGSSGSADPAISHPSGFCAGTVFETDRGPVDVAALRAGDALRCVSGAFVPVSGILSFDGVSDWIGLPGQDREVAVAAGQPMLCRHFLVAALFGVPEAEFPAGHVAGPGIRRPGPPRSLHLPVLSTTAVLSTGGYEFPVSVVTSFPFSPLRSAASGPEGRAGSAGSVLRVGSRPPISGQPLRERSSPARVLLTPAQVRQLCDAGVLFRGAGR